MDLAAPQWNSLYIASIYTILHNRKTEERKELDKKQVNDQKAKLEIGNDHSTLLLLLVLGQEGKREKNG